MIPVIFGSDAKTYTTNGLGRLADAVSCLVYEERNGIYELEMTYPITGVHYDKLVEGNIIVTTHDEQKDKQPFIIYRITRPISGIVTVNAHHVSYALSNVIIAPFTASGVAEALNEMSSNAITDNPFTFWTDKTSSGTMTNKMPTPAKTLLGGTRGSILDCFGGGEYEFDGYTVKLYAHRGDDNGVTIRYGKNLTDVKAERDVLGLYNAVIPYWSNNDDTVVYGGVVVGNGGIRNTAYWNDENSVPIQDENSNLLEFSYYVQQITTMDLSSEFDDQPTPEQLEARALTILNSNQPWLPKDNIKIDFVALWQTEEYADVAPLERVKLCDTVSVYYPELGVNATSKVIKVTWDALLDRYDSIELGEAKSSFADVITADTIEQTMEENKSMMDEAIQHATDLITGGLGGHIVFLYDANGHPTDLLAMDTADVTTAVNVLRINVNGIGFSSSGVSGTYRSAWTLDGAFVADFITAGHLSANRIQGGTLTLGGSSNGNGILSVKNASGTEVGKWDKDGIVVNSGSISCNVIKGGTLILGGSNNTSGVCSVRNTSNTEIVKLNSDGISVSKGTITGSTITLGGSSNGNGTLTVKNASGTTVVTLNNNGISATAGTFSGSLSSATGTFSGSLSAATGTFSGSLSAATGTFNGAIVNAGANQKTEINNGFIFFLNRVGSGYTSASATIFKENNDLTLLGRPGVTIGRGTYEEYYEIMGIGQSLVDIAGSLEVSGSKSRVADTQDYGKRYLYAYETPTPLFGDVGDGVIGEDGKCFVQIDSIFAETVNLSQYQVFLQKYGDGDCYVSERNGAYFVVEGTPGLAFGWEIKAKQAGYDQLRMRKKTGEMTTINETDYAVDLLEHIAEIRHEREVA